MANSPLVTYQYLGHGKYNARRNPISGICIHDLSAVGDFDLITTTIGTFNVSWNYGINSYGKVGMFAEESQAAYSTGSPDNDDKCVNIVVCNNSEGPEWTISPRAYSTLIELCADICKRNNITQLIYDRKNPRCNLTIHKWFNPNVNCPGKYILDRMKDIQDEVNSKIKADKVVEKKKSSKTRLLYGPQADLFTIEVQVAIDSNGNYLSGADIDALEAAYQVAAAGYAATGLPGGPPRPSYTVKWITLTPDNPIDFPILDYKITVNREAIHPYIVTVSEKMNKLDMQALVDGDVIGVYLPAGSLFDKDHKTKNYPPATLKQLVDQCDSVNMPYGLVGIVRAYTVAEARYEASNLYKVVSKYPPELGIWIQLDINDKSAPINDILAYYYDCFAKWGFSDKCGLYLTKSQVSKIPWESKWKDKYMLNLIDHVSNINKLDEVLTQTFFNL